MLLRPCGGRIKIIINGITVAQTKRNTGRLACVPSPAGSRIAKPTRIRLDPTKPNQAKADEPAWGEVLYLGKVR